MVLKSASSFLSMLYLSVLSLYFSKIAVPSCRFLFAYSPFISNIICPTGYLGKSSFVRGFSFSSKLSFVDFNSSGAF